MFICQYLELIFLGSMSDVTRMLLVCAIINDIIKNINNNTSIRTNISNNKKVNKLINENMYF